MNLLAIREIARTLDLRSGKRSKTDLIKSIQSAEGNFNCFATAYEGVCDQPQCRWREDCFDSAKKLSAEKI